MVGARGNTFTVVNEEFENNFASCGAGACTRCQRDCANNTLLLNKCHFYRNSILSASTLGEAGLAVGFAHDEFNLFPTNNVITVMEGHFINNSGYYAVGTLAYISSQPSIWEQLTFIHSVWGGNSGNGSPAVEIVPNFIGMLQTYLATTPELTNCLFIRNKVKEDESINTYNAFKNGAIF